MELQNKVAIVTGAGRGIGEGIAQAFAREGAKVVLVARTLSTVTEVATSITAAGGTALALAADVSNEAEVKAMVLATLEHFGAIDILVNNAGIEGLPAPVKDIPEEQWDKVMSINLKGAFLCSKAVIPTMITQQKGKIINISSVAARRISFSGSADYTASKYGLVGLSQHLAWELAEHHINVNTICPGLVLTSLAERVSTPELRDFLTKRLIPLGRFLNPNDIAETAVFLAGEHSSMITSQVWEVDGGFLSGYGEDLRPVIKKRMADMKASHHN